MKTTLSLLIALLFISLAGTAQKSGSVQGQNNQTTAAIDKSAMAAEVKDALLHAWNGYKQYAWGMDALQPISKTGKNWYKESLLMTPVDAYDALCISGLREQAGEARELIMSKLRFDVDMEVQNFEVSIRILGGLLSAYEIERDPQFLELAKDLANRLIPVFNSPTSLPYRYVNLKTGVTRGAVTNPAEIGTYLLEYGTLSKYSGESRYFDIAKKAMVELYNRRSPLGLIGSSINVETGEWLSTESHISGGIDSYYEYLLKGAILFNDKDLLGMWKESYLKINEYLSDKGPNGLWFGQADMNTGKRTGTSYGALDAFYAATLALAGDLENAAALQESSFKMWMLKGIEPEQIDYSKMTIASPGYALRPENIESAYYLYKMTGDEKYLAMGQTMFRNIVKYCKTDAGFAALKNVASKEKEDEMESFFLAETLKYAYLLFDDSNFVEFDKVIFNTEAHPYRRLK